MSRSIPSILIVEKDPREVEILMGLIGEVVRAKVDSISSGERAIDLFSKTSYQIVIADCGLADIDGLWILDRLKRISPSTSIILTSMYASIEESVKAIRNGAEEYFRKPLNPEHFKLAIRRCLDKRELYSKDKDLIKMMNLLNTCQLISGCLEEEKVFETVTSYVKREGFPKAIALFKTENGNVIRIPTTSDLDPETVQVWAEGRNYIQRTVEEKTPIKFFEKGQLEPAVGVFHFDCTKNSNYFIVCVNPSWTSNFDEILSRYRILLAQIQMTGKNIDNYLDVRHLLYLDEPTGLYNTRYMHLHLNHAFERRNQDDKYRFSVLFIDIDKFKTVNDQHGHLIGTKILLEMGSLIRRSLRTKDIAFRYGGDEFIVFLENADAKLASLFAEALRLRIQKNIFLEKETTGLKLTVSIGVASCPEHANNKKDILDAADNAMYNVKRTTRNQVWVAEKKAA